MSTMEEQNETDKIVTSINNHIKSLKTNNKKRTNSSKDPSIDTQNINKSSAAQEQVEYQRPSKKPYSCTTTKTTTTNPNVLNHRISSPTKRFKTTLSNGRIDSKDDSNSRTSTRIDTNNKNDDNYAVAVLLGSLATASPVQQQREKQQQQHQQQQQQPTSPPKLKLQRHPQEQTHLFLEKHTTTTTNSNTIRKSKTSTQPHKPISSYSHSKKQPCPQEYSSTSKTPPRGYGTPTRPQQYMTHDTTTTPLASLTTPQPQQRHTNTPTTPGTTTATSWNHTRENVGFSWESLRLGKELGSIALLEFVSSQQQPQHLLGGSGSPSFSSLVEHWTSHDTLSLVHSLRVKTCLPPKDSPLHAVIQKSPFENKTIQSDALKATTSSHPSTQENPENIISNLYEFMCSQDVDDGTFTRREAYYLSPLNCCDKFKCYENRISALKLHQNSVFRIGRDLGLFPTDTSDFFG